MTIDLILTLVLTLLFIAGVVYMETKFAKMNKTTREQDAARIHRVLKKLGATNIRYDYDGWFSFDVKDETYALNIAKAPYLEILLLNSIEGCTNVGVAEEVAAALTARCAGGGVFFKDENIFFVWDSILAGEDVLEKGIPFLIGYLHQLRDKYIDTYWKTVSVIQKENNKTVS